MAEEQTFRPEKKRLSMADVNREDQDNDQENYDELERIQEIQRMASQMSERGPDMPGGEPDAPPVKIGGNVPPALQAMFANRGKKPQTEPKEHANPAHSPPRPKNRSRPELTTTGHEALDALTARLRATTHAYDRIVLPSLGRFYDGSDGPTDGVLNVRPMTGEEEQILATPRYVKKGRAIDMIFSNCVRENISPERLLTSDRTFLLIFLRGISYTPYYEVEIKCPECSAKFASTINLDELHVDKCPDDFAEESLEDVMPKSGFRFVYRLSRGDDESQVTAYRENRVRLFGDNAIDDTLAFRTSLLLQEVEDLRDQRQIQLLAKSLPIGDMNYVRNLVNEPPFGVKTDIDIQCPSCFADFTVDLPMETNFFFPRRKKEETRA